MPTASVLTLLDTRRQNAKCNSYEVCDAFTTSRLDRRLTSHEINSSEPRIAGTDNTGISQHVEESLKRSPYIKGHICAISLYRIWKDTTRPAVDAKSTDICDLNSLCSILFKRSDVDEYTVEYALTKFSATLTAEAWDLELACKSSASLAAIANDSSKPGHMPLNSIDRPSVWKAMYCASIDSLRTTIGFPGLYRRVRLSVNDKTGLVESCILCDVNERQKPALAIITTEGCATLDRRDVKTAAITSGTEGGATIAFSRMRALRARDSPGKRGLNDACSIKINTKTSTFFESYGHQTDMNSVYEPKEKRHKADNSVKDGTSDLLDEFVIQTRTLNIPNVTGGAVTVTSMVPKRFDCLITYADDFSTTASIVSYTHWYASIYGTKHTFGNYDRKLSPIFSYIGPEMYQKGEDRDYCLWVGFPGWQIIKSSKADKESVDDAVSAYVLSDGLWPATGPRAFHSICGRLPAIPQKKPTPNIIEKLCDLKTSTDDRTSLKSLTEQWPSGRIKCSLPGCVAIRNTPMAKYDFSSFFPTLYLSLFPNDTRLIELVNERMTKRRSWTKRALVEFCGMLKNLDATTYESLNMLGNGVAEVCERCADASGLAVFSYVKDGFWGAIDLSNENLVGNDLVSASELVRRSCERAANAFIVNTCGLSFPENIKLSMRTERTFTDAISWNCGCYYVTDRNISEHGDLIGFPTRHGVFGADAKRLLCAELRKFLIEDLSETELLINTAAACETLVELAFENRNNSFYWTCDKSGPSATASADGAWLAELLANSSLADRSSVNSGQITAVTADGRETAVYTALFTSPVIVPAIACETHATQVFSAIAKLVNAIAESDRSDEDQAEESNKTLQDYFNFTDYSFLFIKNK